MTRRRLFVTLLCLLIAIAIPAGIVAGAYAHFASKARSEVRRNDLSRGSDNALKHAFAASETFALLRKVGLSSEMAVRVVRALGNLNEQAEFHLRSVRRQDPPREIYKDFWNNEAGMLTAAWAERRGIAGSAGRLQAISWLAGQGGLLLTAADPRVPALQAGPQSALDTATEAFARNRQRATEAVGRSLKTLRPD